MCYEEETEIFMYEIRNKSGSEHVNNSPRQPFPESKGYALVVAFPFIV